MSKQSTNLGLFEAVPATDGASYFNFDTHLNNNWEIIDAAMALLRGGVADITSLKAIAQANVKDGMAVMVNSKGLFQYNAASSLTADDVRVVTPNFNTGRWLLIASLIGDVDRYLEVPGSAYGVVNKAGSVVIEARDSVHLAHNVRFDGTNWYKIIDNMASCMLVVKQTGGCYYYEASASSGSTTTPITWDVANSINLRDADTVGGKHATDFNNILVSYNGTTQIDPNTTLEGAILTNHANSPKGVGGQASNYYIYTHWYSAVGADKNREQIARGYSGANDMWIRYYYTGAWSAWQRLFTEASYGFTTSAGSNFTLGLTQAFAFVLCNNASAAITATVPPNSTVAFPIGTEITLVQDATYAVTVAAGSGVTIRSKGGKLATNGQYSAITLKKYGTDIWYLIGDLA